MKTDYYRIKLQGKLPDRQTSRSLTVNLISSGQQIWFQESGSGILLLLLLLLLLFFFLFFFIYTKISKSLPIPYSSCIASLVSNSGYLKSV
jgi:hypothetical protein